MCYRYNTDGGCQKWEDIPFCRNPGDAFELKEVYLNLNLKNFLANSSYSPSDCRDTCWKNCSCDGFTDYYDDGTGCIFVYLNLTEGADFASGGEKFYILVKNTHHKGKSTNSGKESKSTIISQLPISHFNLWFHYSFDPIITPTLHFSLYSLKHLILIP